MHVGVHIHTRAVVSCMYFKDALGTLALCVFFVCIEVRKYFYAKPACNQIDAVIHARVYLTTHVHARVSIVCQ